jgi:toxin CptA
MHIGAFLIALTAVGTMGFANQRGGTCTVAALEEVVLKRTFKRLIALFEASLWAAAGFVLLSAAGLLAAIPVNYAVGVETTLGGVLFGIGAFVNGACIFGTIARLGSGELSYLAMPLGFYLSTMATAYLPGPTQLDSRSPLIAASAWLAVPVIPLVLVRLYTHIRYMRQTGRDLLDHIWSPHVATTIIGITFVVMMAVQQNWTYAEVLSELAHGMTSGLFGKILLGIALLGGAILGGVTAGRFKIAAPDLASMLRHLAGGALMGAGGLLIPGGNTGLALVGLPLLWPYAWLAFMSICITIYIALRLKARRNPAADVCGSLGHFRPRSGGMN